MKKRAIMIVLVLALAVLLTALAGVAMARAVYWQGGDKVSFSVGDPFTDFTWPACVTNPDTYQWSVTDPDGTFIAGSNQANVTGGQFTPTISGRYKVTVKAMVGGQTVDILRGTLRYTAP